MGQIKLGLRCHNGNKGAWLCPPSYIKLDIVDNIISKKFAITFLGDEHVRNI